MNAIDLFSGAGGFTLALKTVGFRVLFANEINPIYAQTHNINFPDIPMIQKDIKKITKNDLQKLINTNTVDLIVGGPPCQGFSIFGKRRFINTKGYEPQKDKRNLLVYEFINLVKKLTPKFFFIENVKGFVNLDKGLFLEKVKKRFHEIGYRNIWCEIVCAADFGVPQERYRMFMIGNRIGIDFIAPKATHFPIGSGNFPEYNTVGKAIFDLQGKENKIQNHVPLKHKPIVAARYGYVKEGNKLNMNDLPAELAVATRKDSKTGIVSNYSHVYKRLDRNKPSTTMVPGHNAFPIHPILNRTLTAREAARLQTFPDSYIFCGIRQEQCIQVGNAVPPKMVEPFIKKIVKYLKGENV
jgi:DNA (cytosine-5)-methyltransferase 1